MKERTADIIRGALSGIVALLLMSMLFAALPGLRNAVSRSPAESTTVVMDRRPMPEMKKEETVKRRVPMQVMRTVKAQASVAADRVAAESFKFAPDLSIQGGGDIAAPERRQVRAQVYSEDETDVRPTLFARTPVPYPPEARRKAIEGTVDMEILVDESGKVVRVSFNQLPSELFRAPVSGAVMRWRFKPAQVKGVAVSVRVRQKITFRLSQASD